MKIFISFRPLMGIILFNYVINGKLMELEALASFRPLMGIILFNPVFEITGIY